MSQFDLPVTQKITIKAPQNALKVQTQLERKKTPYFHSPQKKKGEGPSLHYMTSH
jgi:hypothetical protein